MSGLCSVDDLRVWVMVGFENRGRVRVSGMGEGGEGDRGVCRGLICWKRIDGGFYLNWESDP